MARTLILALIVCLTACTYNPFSSQNNLTGNAMAPVLGGALGAGVPALLGASKTVIVTGGLVGASLMYYSTTLRFAAGGILQGGGQVYTVGEYVGIDLPTDCLFDTNSDELLPEAGPVLSSVVAVLKRFPHHNIIVVGNTSGFYAERFERKISENRAKQVAAYLWVHGVTNPQTSSVNIGSDRQYLINHPLRQLIYTGFGNYFPISNDIRNEGIRQNSHIQITAYPPADEAIIRKHCKLCYNFNNIGAIDERNNLLAPPPVFSEVKPPRRPSLREQLDEAFVENPPPPGARISSGPGYKAY